MIVVFRIETYTGVSICGLPMSEVYTEESGFICRSLAGLRFTWGVIMVETYWLLETVRSISWIVRECEWWRGKIIVTQELETCLIQTRSKY